MGLALGATVERDAHVNRTRGSKELWLRDPGGYLVMVAEPAPYRPRP